MNSPARIAFYAPLKPPDHPIPSGDRRMANNLLRALKKAGYDVTLASRYICYSKRHSDEYFDLRKNGAIAEADRLIAEWEQKGYRPDLWFTFHNYCKAPDWLGMEICSRLNIPLVHGKPCKTGQGPNGEWDKWRVESQRSIAMAETNIVMTDIDKAYLETLVAPEKIHFIPPFIDPALLERPDETGEPLDVAKYWQSGTRFFAAGMMRPGAKMESYSILAKALEQLNHHDWSLVIAGGGPGLDEVKEMFSWDKDDRVNILGEIAPAEVLKFVAAADVLTWPGWREAYGMVYLEAASVGTPVAALRHTGVPLVVENERTGLLADPPTVEAYREVLARFMDEPNLSEKLSASALAFYEDERSGKTTAEELKRIIDPIIEAHHGR